MISTYVKKLRLRQELQALRSAHHLTQEQLARRAGVSRGDIQLLENGRSTDQSVVLDILECLEVEEERWTQVVETARAASEDGWWESAKGIGDRQALYADLEAGAAIIRAYEQTFVPGLLQIPEYLRAGVAASAALNPSESDVAEGMLAGRLRRQRMLRRPGGPRLEVIVDEVVVRRPAAPPAVMKEQLRHLADIAGDGQPNVTLRVLPVRAGIKDYTVPRCSFSVYAYPDARDPKVAAIDTVTEDVILTADAEVSTYETLFQNLWNAAASSAESADLITSAAGELPDS